MERCEDYPCCGHSFEDGCPGEPIECSQCGAQFAPAFYTGSRCGGCLAEERAQRQMDRDEY